MCPRPEAPITAPAWVLAPFPATRPSCRACLCRWERPDLQGLREFCSVHFNWPQAKADEHLLPVMKAYEVTTSQTHIDS